MVSYSKFVEIAKTNSISNRVNIKGVTAKMSVSLSISGHTLVVKSPKLSQSQIIRVIFFLERFDSRAEFKRRHRQDVARE